MTDVFTKAQRSAIMARVKSKGTKPELAYCALLEKTRLSFEDHPRIYGNPDFLVNRKVVVFIDSAFWHGRNWPNLKKKLEAGARAEYWVRHIDKNRRRDREVTRRLADSGYTVLRVWDSDLRRNPEACVTKLLKVARVNECN